MPKDVVAELGEAQARADRLAARLAELRLQISVFAPEGDEALGRAREASDQLRKMSERIQILERQLANARVREESLTSQIVRWEAAVADLEIRVLEIPSLAARANSAEAAAAQAQRRITMMEGELAADRAEREGLLRERDEARGRAENERVLAQADRLRAEEAGRMLADLQARAGGVEGALGRIAEMEAELARAFEQAERSAAARRQDEPRVDAPRPDLPRLDSLRADSREAGEGPDLAMLMEERDALVNALEMVQARLAALEEVAAHAASLETELEAARTRIPEIRSAADAAGRRAAELSEALQTTRSERDAARAALEGRIGDVQALRARVTELEVALAGPRPAEANPAGEPSSEAKIWLGDVAGEIIDISQVEPTAAGDEEPGDETAAPAENTSHEEAREVPPANGSVWN